LPKYLILHNSERRNKRNKRKFVPHFPTLGGVPLLGSSRGIPSRAPKREVTTLEDATRESILQDIQELKSGMGICPEEDDRILKQIAEAEKSLAMIKEVT
jgi:hypothetical protein